MKLRTVLKWGVRVSAALGLAGSLAIIGVTHFSSATDHRHFKITSGSMTPTIAVGEVITVRTTQSPRVGDMITFLHDGKTVTHRVTYSWNAMSPDGTRHVMFKTKGDANKFEDPWAVLDNQVIGTVSSTSPMVLLAVELSEHPMVLAALFLPFLISVIFNELRNMFAVVTGTHNDDDKECPERESNPQGVATRGV